jgi:oxaloacetate decarboxylase beta subunit
MTIPDAILAALGGYLHVIQGFGAGNGVMIAVGAALLFLGIARGLEPLLLLPIGFGAILVNMPGAGLMEPGGFLRTIYDAGIVTELFPLLIFVGIGALTDFGPLFSDPKLLLLGAAGQLGIFLTLLLALVLGFPLRDSVAIGIIGAMDGPTAIFVSAKYAPHLLAAVSVAAYSYMSLVPILQPPIMRLLTTASERRRVMPPTPSVDASRAARVVFPVAITILGGILAPQGVPLLGTIMLGNLLRESGVVDRLKAAAQNEIANVVTLLLGISIGATMQAELFLRPQTLLVFGLGLIAIVLDTAAGVLFGRVYGVLSGGRINPLIGAAGISAYPMAARVVQRVGQQENRKSYLLMPAMAANTGGQVGSVLAASVMLAALAGLGIV